MSVVIASIAAIAVVLGILVAVGYGLFETTPFAHRANEFRDGHGRRVGSSPRLD